MCFWLFWLIMKLSIRIHIILCVCCMCLCTCGYVCVGEGCANVHVHMKAICQPWNLGYPYSDTIYPIYPSIHLSIHLSICQSIRLSIYVFKTGSLTGTQGPLIQTGCLAHKPWGPLLSSFLNWDYKSAPHVWIFKWVLGIEFCGAKASRDWASGADWSKQRS